MNATSDFPGELRRQASALKKWWGEECSGAVRLHDAHVLLDIEEVEGAIRAHMMEFCRPPGRPTYFDFPLRDIGGSLIFFDYRQGAAKREVIAHLRQRILDHLRDGTLLAVGAPPETAIFAKMQPISSDRWKLGTVDFDNCTISVNGNVSAVGIEVRRAKAAQRTGHSRKQQASAAQIIREVAALAAGGLLPGRQEVIRLVKAKLPGATEKPIREAMAAMPAEKKKAAHRPRGTKVGK